MGELSIVLGAVGKRPTPEGRGSWKLHSLYACVYACVLVLYTPSLPIISTRDSVDQLKGHPVLGTRVHCCPFPFLLLRARSQFIYTNLYSYL